MSITISAEQAKALWHYFESTLDPSRLSQLWRAVEKGDFESADRVAREYADTLEFLVKDLRWGVDLSGEIELSSPPELLHSVFTRVSEEAAQIRKAGEPDQTEARQEEEWNRLLEDAARGVLAALHRGEG